MNEYVGLAGFAVGLAAAVGAIAYTVADALAGVASGITPRTFPRFRRLSRARKKKKTNTGQSSMNAAFTLGSAAGGLMGALFAWGAPAFYSAVGVGSAAGALAGWFLHNNLKESRRLKLLREVAVLYESVEFYTRAGYTIQQALKLGAVLTPLLNAPAERCLAAWPAGPVRALETFAREVDLPEAAVLSSVLVHAEESGMAFGASTIQEESRSLEELRRNLVELKIASKPLYFAVYRALPMAAVGGVMVGPLAYKLIKTLQMFAGT